MTAEPRLSDDRSEVARILFELAVPGLLQNAADDAAPLRIEYREEPVARVLGGHLSAAQLEYVTRSMAPCPPYLVTSAEHRITWRDSRGIVNVAHTGPLGAVVPVVAREATLALWARLDADPDLRARTAALPESAIKLLAATTTDRTALEVFRTGVDAAARTVVQHAFLVGQTPYGDAAGFARGIAESAVFDAVATTWYWGLQASTYRRGMIPASFLTFAGRVRYSVDTVVALRAMKDAQLARAQDAELEPLPSAVQYSRLAPGERPRCLARTPHLYDGGRASVLAVVADTFVETFVHLLDRVGVAPAVVEHAAVLPTVDAEVFEVPDMTCSHCTRTITKVLGELGVEPPEFDLVTKKVVAVFPSAEVRERGFEAIRARGYTVVPLQD
ncbi:heavy-metal-associated domain-containing protein [Kribbella sandramycini]|uniref:Copper chaperone CopZ n=1 Tax=Kribbella sandramycini TaxID=60450 RepID=A0A7Y4KY17_9ACTN|nr:heavy-metal-associated domain-containing protein [Kribbella sandramycini]MBB6569415.1 copper chaperone CopZ [Kribbella sandramycini]NOL40749.1 heavy-metal-associated domain-containing protein [Kribbella sandramycini]